jgi:hypothetical protein
VNHTLSGMPSIMHPVHPRTIQNHSDVIKTP